MMFGRDGGRLGGSGLGKIESIMDIYNCQSLKYLLLFKYHMRDHRHHKT